MEKTSDILQRFLQKAQQKKRKIGIAIMRPIPETMKSLEKAAKYADLTVVGAKVKGFKNIVEADPDKASQKLIKLLKGKQVEGIVRGQVKDSYTLDEFFRQFQKKPIPSNRKIALAIIQQAGRAFVVGSCSVYFGNSLKDKMHEAGRLIKYMKEDLGIDPKIAVMSSRRPTSKIGAVDFLEKIALMNEKFASRLKKKGYPVREYYIEYETAVWENWANLIFPSTGLVGNAWLKALLYLGGWQLIACPYLDLGVVYEDGTRNEKNFYWHIVHAVAWLNGSEKI